MNDVIAAVLSHLEAEGPAGVVGLYLYGSGATQLQGDSDIDLLLLTQQSLTLEDRKRLVDVLMPLSGWRGHARRFPDAAERRPIELTGLVVGRLHTEPDRAHRDFQYGEWMREDIMACLVPQPTDDPDVVLLIATALSRHRVLRGPALEEILPAVPLDHLREAALRIIPGVIQNAVGDERNALLTMARIVVTRRTGTIVSKTAAADVVIPSLPQPDRGLMERARAGYLHSDDGEWTADADQVRDVLKRLSIRAVDSR